MIKYSKHLFDVYVIKIILSMTDLYVLFLHGISQ